MRRLLIVVALVASAAVPGPTQAQQVSAEKLFQQMEKKLQDAKTVQFGYDIKISGGGKPMGTGKGKVVLDKGDKFRLDGNLPPNRENSTMVADGTKMFFQERPTANIGSKNVPKNLGAYFRGSWVRVGLLASFDDGLKNDPSPKAADVFVVSDFKLGAKENVNGVETQVIEYKITHRSKAIFNAKMWVAVKRSLPVQLELRFEAMGGVVEFSETYTDWVLDAKVDPKLFQPPQ